MTDLLFKTNYKYIGSESDLKDQIRTFSVHNPTLSLISRASHSIMGRQKRPFHEHEYDLYEIGRIIDTESFVTKAFQKKHTLLFRNGFRITSKNKQNLAYIKQRLEEIQYVSGKAFRKFLREYGYNLIAFHNAYIVKARKETASTGKRRLIRGGREIPPVAAYFSLPSESVQTMIDEAGEPLRFRQFITGTRYREFPVHNVIHSYYNKRTGYTMGTPPLESVKDDILALRRIEESVETLIYKSLFPIIHVKVGTEKRPAKTLPNGRSEVDNATHLLESLEDNGGLVTSERIEVKAIGSESLALRVESYLTHFKNRVFAGLGMSGIDFGDGDATGRATGEVLSSALKDSVLDYQAEIEEVITREVFDELLLESGRYKHSFEISEDDRVYLIFNTVDIDEKIKKENHVLNKANSGAITTFEMRSELGYEDLEDLNELHAVAFAKVQGENQLDTEKELLKEAAKHAPKPAAGAKPSGSKPSSSTKKTTGGNTKTKQSKTAGAGKAAKAATKPSNQHTRDTLHRKLLDYAVNRDIHTMTLGAYRILADYYMLKATFGLVSVNDHIDSGLDKIVRSNISDLVALSAEDDVNSSKIARFIKKMLDNLDSYVNNITTGL